MDIGRCSPMMDWTATLQSQSLSARFNFVVRYWGYHRRVLKINKEFRWRKKKIKKNCFIYLCQDQFRIKNRLCSAKKSHKHSRDYSIIFIAIIPNLSHIPRCYIGTISCRITYSSHIVFECKSLLFIAIIPTYSLRWWKMKETIPTSISIDSATDHRSAN